MVNQLVYLFETIQRVYVDIILCLLIVRQPLLQVMPYVVYQLLPLLLLQQRANRVAYLEVANYNLGRRVHKHRNTSGVHIVHIVEVAGSATTNGDHYILKLCQFMEHVILYFAKSLFATLGENVGHLAAKTLLNKEIEVVEAKTKLARHDLADRRFASSHVAD